MSEDDKASARYSKGDQLAIAHGKSNVGVRGEIFWTGANKYGPGFRYGLKDENGETYWVDEADLGPIEGAPPPPPPKAAPTGPAKDPIAKGATVKITGGREGVGKSGEIFWVGDSKFGQGMRYGIKTPDGTTFWVDGMFVDQTAAAPARASGSNDSPRTSRSSSSNEFNDGGDFNEFSDVPASSMPTAPPSFDDEPPLEDDDVRYDADDFGGDFNDEDMPF